MGLFDSTEEEPSSKVRRYVITTLVFIALILGGCWYLLRFHTEKDTIRHFMNDVIAGNMQEAYKIWQPSQSYAFKDFLDDWGPNGYYGPVKSYNIEDTERLKDSTAVVIVVDVSPDQPFPDDRDAVKQNRVKQIKLWVEFKDQSISFPPF
ncbi:MAG: hypothetical protein ACRD4S_10685 [Candidatus Acidiferrales bacterium]